MSELLRSTVACVNDMSSVSPDGTQLAGAPCTTALRDMLVFLITHQMPERPDGGRAFCSCMGGLKGYARTARQ
jgi:hypothetical protein